MINWESAVRSHESVISDWQLEIRDWNLANEIATHLSGARNDKEEEPGNRYALRNDE